VHVTIKYRYTKESKGAVCIVYSTESVAELKQWGARNGVETKPVVENGVGIPHYDMGSFQSRGKPVTPEEFRRDVKNWKKAHKKKTEEPSFDEELRKAVARAEGIDLDQEDEEEATVAKPTASKKQDTDGTDIKVVTEMGMKGVSISLRVDDLDFPLTKEQAENLAGMLNAATSLMPK